MQNYPSPFLNASQLASGQQSSYGPAHMQGGQLMQQFNPGWAGGMDSHNGTSRVVGNALAPQMQAVPGWEHFMQGFQPKPAVQQQATQAAPSSSYQQEMAMFNPQQAQAQPQGLSQQMAMLLAKLGLGGM